MSQPIELSSLSPILNSCKTARRNLEALDENIKTLQHKQTDFVNGRNITKTEINNAHATLIMDYRVLLDRVRNIKSQSGASDPRAAQHISSLQRQVEESLERYRNIEHDFQKQLQDQQRRQILIVNPDASEAEIESAIGVGGDVQIFQQALLNSNRNHQAHTALESVRQRHNALQQIQQTLTQLDELFTTLATVIEEQERPIADAELKSGQAIVDLENGNREMSKTKDIMERIRRMKWILLGIWVAIFVLILIIVLIVLKVLHVI